MSRDPYKYFRIEARELTDQLSKGVLVLEKEGALPDVIAGVLRAAHTLKGAARVVKQREIADAAHGLEDLLAEFRDDSGGGDRRASIDRMLILVDGMTQRLTLLTAAPDGGATASKPAPDAAQDTSEPPRQTLRADVADMDQLLGAITEAHVQLDVVRRGALDLERARALTTRLSELLAKTRGGLVDPVRSPKLPALADELSRVLAGLERNLNRGSAGLGRELGQARQSAQQLRLMPVSALFLGLERTVRDVAHAQSKHARLQTKALDVRIDAQVLDAVQPALVQIVRNAVAHGIELPAERAAAGKPAIGTVRIEIARRGRRVVFACEDDGRGVDLEAVRKAANRKGFAASEISLRDPAQLLHILMHGGLSTSDAVTAVSGRGVGLDLVRDVSTRLGGEVSVQTRSGLGTRIELSVPVSLSAFDALLVEAQGVTAAIPLDAVRKTKRLLPGDITRNTEGSSIIHDGKVVAFTPLSSQLSMRRSSESATPRAWSAVLVQVGASTAALGVDRLLGTDNVVLQALPASARSLSVVAGATLDTRGAPRLVLDPEALVSAAGAGEPTPVAASTPPLPILVIDDSLTTRMLEQSILESAGYRTEVATCAEDALEQARINKYALFLVDVEMPGMSGFEFVERTRADPALRDVPAILVTSRDAAEDKQRGHAAGASAYIVKSEFDQVALLDLISRLVRSR